MRLAVISHKICWESPNSPSGYATDGGFPLQMRTISELFDETRLVVPVARTSNATGEVALAGRNLAIRPLDVHRGKGLARKLTLPLWLLGNLPTMVREIKQSDAVHTPIPGDIGTVGLLVALLLRKPLLIRHCGNWSAPRTIAEYFWRWLLERTAGDQVVVFATGGATGPPSPRNPKIRWIFSTSLRESELKACAAPRAGFAAAGPRLIIACRQEREKGTGAVIESLSLLEEEHPNISLDVVGDGAALSEFRKIADKFKVAHRVRFHGKVDHGRVMELLANADLFCFPTRSSEGFPKGVLEALASGLPVVSTRVSVLPDLVGEGGMLIDNVTAHEVARGIRWCLADTARYEALSSAALRTAQHYSLERWRDTIGSFLIPGWGRLRSANA
jgi:glycosyltransferase involved in cell wall biosynthesis